MQLLRRVIPPALGEAVSGIHQGRAADADTRGTARRADGDQTDIRAAVLGVAFRFGNIGIDV